MKLLILFAIITVIDAGILFLLVPRFIGDSENIHAPDFLESLMHCGIANGLGWLGAITMGTNYLSFAYFLYLFWHKLGLNKLAVIACLVIMAISNTIAANLLIPVLF